MAGEEGVVVGKYEIVETVGGIEKWVRFPTLKLQNHTGDHWF